ALYQVAGVDVGVSHSVLGVSEDREIADAAGELDRLSKVRPGTLRVIGRQHPAQPAPSQRSNSGIPGAVGLGHRLVTKIDSRDEVEPGARSEDRGHERARSIARLATFDTQGSPNRIESLAARSSPPEAPQRTDELEGFVGMAVLGGPVDSVPNVGQ